MDNDIGNFLNINFKNIVIDCFNKKFSGIIDKLKAIPSLNNGSLFIISTKNIPKEKETILTEAVF